MEVIGGIVGFANLLLSAIVGGRLVKLARTTPAGPELWLAGYFLLAAFMGMGLSNFVYMSWADASLALPDDIGAVLNALYLFGVTSGMACLYVFTWRTFRANSGWARRLVLAVTALMLVGYVTMGWVGDFTLKLVPGAAYWTTWVLRTSVFLWLAIESLHYWGLQRRRMRLGLAEPLIANRFLLWGIWSATMLSMGQLDPLARFWYVTQFGAEGGFVPELGRPMVLMIVTASSAAGILVMTTVYLTFFPTTAFRRWIERRAASSDSGAVPRQAP
jgi:hypothetical protein